MNTKKKGDIGLGKAIAYYTSLGNTICIPLTDSQDYDLVVDDGEFLKRIQVKRCTYKRNGISEVSLTVKGGNRSSTGKIKKFDAEQVEIIVISTADDLYIIPTNEIGNKQSMKLGKKYDCFKV